MGGMFKDLEIEEKLDNNVFLGCSTAGLPGLYQRHYQHRQAISKGLLFHLRYPVLYNRKMNDE